MKNTLLIDVQGKFLSHAQCSHNWLKIHHEPDKDKPDANDV